MELEVKTEWAVAFFAVSEDALGHLEILGLKILKTKFDDLL